ncbi:DUF3732 domain-containing protein [Marinifilum flexuosum]|uniref:Uncharacterized protein DUF3732 n=1 Tax=Marinifilum flexuosum TaxID=1117708 RepID=A0A419WF14_9BACT|nr:DUF3732 domain-containing protein [Marinifilum flexuosum]RKD94084.1 uncharacterized protein DUF3732 [Marinifilum flexuosum]
MKFYIKKILLWLKDSEQPRELEFKPNKINVITGAPGTGKSSILAIIDYCLLGSETKIPEDIINENILWYGLDFKINGKDYFIARQGIVNEVLSSFLYFSSNGEIPDELSGNIGYTELKRIIETDFGVNQDLVIPYGGKKIKAGSKISFRYFLLFNTQSENVVDNSNTFFDFDLYDSEKYREALDRIFDLSIGALNQKNTLIKEKVQSLNKEKLSLERKQKILEKEYKLFSEKILELISKAQEYDLIEFKLFEIQEGYSRLKHLISDYKEDKISTDISLLEELYSRRRNIARTIRNIKAFDSEYTQYQKTLKFDFDSLLPIQAISESSQELIINPEVAHFIEGLESELRKIKQAISGKKSMNNNLSSKLKELNEELKDVQGKIDTMPMKSNDFKNNVSKYIFIGELKAKLAFYDKETEQSSEIENRIEEIDDELELLSQGLEQDASERRILLEMLESFIQKNIDECKSLGNYTKYKAFFDTKKKVLKLRKPDKASPINQIGSSSNHMFLHLFLFLGLHEHFINLKVPYIPSFLILDQISRPYFDMSVQTEGKETKVSEDKQKLTDALTLLNSFMDRVLQYEDAEFQIILLEHASKDYWENEKLLHYHLVEEFRFGNALIPNK